MDITTLGDGVTGAINTTPGEFLKNYEEQKSVIYRILGFPISREIIIPGKVGIKCHFPGNPGIPGNRFYFSLKRHKTRKCPIL
jgi:hypothetical protein